MYIFILNFIKIYKSKTHSKYRFFNAIKVLRKETKSNREWAPKEMTLLFFINCATLNLQCLAKARR